MRVFRHTLYNIAGLVAPIAAALISTPILVRDLGADRFGILTLVWAIVNYFGIFDLGLGRALTLQISIQLAKDDHGSVRHLIRSALAALLGMGTIAAVILYFGSPYIVARIQGSADSAEISSTVHAIVFALPFIVATSGVRGVLEAKHAFGILNIIRVPMGLLNFVGPVLIVLYGSNRLDDISWLLSFARVLSLGLHMYFMCRMLPELVSTERLDWSWIRVLLQNGGWMTVSNLVGPLMGYLDRFIVGFILSAALVTYYATPQELVLKVYILPGALTAVLFPRFASDHVLGTAKALYRKSVALVGVLMAGFCLFTYIFSYKILAIWISPSFASQSFEVLRLLLMGIFAGTVSSIPYTYLQAIGNSNKAAISHTLQLPLFLAGSYFLTSHFGIKGAAVAWSVRLLLDAVIMFALVASDTRRNQAAVALPVKR